MNKFIPIILRYDSHHFIGMKGRKCFAISRHEHDEYRLTLEDKDFCYQRLLSAKEVVNLANWLDVACRNIINLRSKNVTCSTMTLMLDKNIKLEIEYQCNDQLQSQYETMFSISFGEISMLFNVTASRDFKALALASKELLA